MSQYLKWSMPIFLMGVVLGSGGCASIVSSGPDKVMFTSEPKGAMVTIDGAQVGVTPVEAEVSRKARSIEFSLAGYERCSLAPDRHLNGWIFGNLIFGGIIGVVIDIATGNSMKAEPTMNVTLRKGAAENGTSFERAIIASWLLEPWRSWLAPPALEGNSKK